MAGQAETILLYIVVVLLAARLGGEAARRLKQPPVVGEILLGIVVGPSLLHIIPSFDILDALNRYILEGGIAPAPAEVGTAQALRVLSVLAEIGVLILLFEVGLESNLGEFRRLGVSVILVGVYGVVFSLAIGAGASYLFAQRIAWVLTPNAQAAPHLLHLFVGAILTATSVGITARVLGDLGKIRARESQIILGAAVIDDVLGLIVLAIVGGLITNPGAVNAFGIGRVLLYSIGFFVLAIALGRVFAPRMLEFVHKTFRSEYIHLAFAFTFMMLVAYLATVVGLASIIGAFAAGLALSGSGHRHIIFEHVKPVGSLFVSFFFVVLGARVDLSRITAETLPLVLVIGLLLAGVGILAKLMAGWGVVGVKASRYVVGVGMVPRGEVGLIFALFGLEHLLLENWQYTTIIIVVLLTTLVTPAWLKALRGRFAVEMEPEAPGQSRLQEAVTP